MIKVSNRLECMLLSPMLKIISLTLFFAISLTGASASWTIMIDEDSSGQRCLLYKETEESKDNFVEDTKRYAYFTIVSSVPLRTEFAVKFPSSISLVKDPKIKIAETIFPLISKKGFGWLRYKKNEVDILKYISTEKSMTVLFTTDGRHREETVLLSGLNDALSSASKECRFKT
jgi:hypothetical protein